MAKYEFHFVVSDVELTEAEEARVSRAVAEAGALALASATPANAVTVRAARNIWWRGIPAASILAQLEEYAQKQAES